ncbi:MAG: Nif3-like dinuclear metal center hexameric protein [Cyclobacteriaceae bacterium]
MRPTKVKDLLSYLNEFAPFQLQESYDNSGLLTGDPDMLVTGILISLDCTEAVVDEAIEKGCNVVVSHHPILFKPIKSLTGKDHVERTIIKAIRNQLALIAVHTNLDNVKHGVNAVIADRLGLKEQSILSPLQGNLHKLVTYVPESHAGNVLNALHAAGAGHIGKYSHCSFRSEGTGSFMPGNEAEPFQGQRHMLEQTKEIKIEVLVPAHLENPVLEALRESHPYEEVAYFLSSTLNRNQETGAGMMGTLPEPVKASDFLESIKSFLQCQVIRHTPICHEKIQKVAVCGGSGSFLLKKAISSGAELFISADFKYHDFFGAEGKIIIADIGHFESEQFTKDLLTGVLSKKFPNFAVTFSKIVTNPISYL